MYHTDADRPITTLDPARSTPARAVPATAIVSDSVLAGVAILAAGALIVSAPLGLAVAVGLVFLAYSSAAFALSRHDRRVEPRRTGSAY